MFQGAFCHLYYLILILVHIESAAITNQPHFTDSTFNGNDDNSLEIIKLEDDLSIFSDNSSGPDALPLHSINTAKPPPENNIAVVAVVTSSQQTPTSSINSTKMKLKSRKVLQQKQFPSSSISSLQGNTAGGGGGGCLGGVSLKPMQPILNTTLKSHRTDAPMLNYIFDSHVISKHHHHDFRLGPHFEDVDATGGITNITVQSGSTAYFNCRISLLQDKTVSWVRRNQDTDEMQLLTVGLHTYSADSRYTVEFQYPNNWRLKISLADRRDEGIYECQISTHPPRVIQIYFQVSAPEVVIVDEQGMPLYDKYYEVDSTLQLVCIVRNVAMTTSVVNWLHGDAMLNYDATRGGISVKTDLMDEGANSTLSVARVNKSDSGNYTCSIGPTQYFTTSVHVLNESLAELYHGSCDTVKSSSLSILFLLFLITLTHIIYVTKFP